MTKSKLTSNGFFHQQRHFLPTRQALLLPLPPATRNKNSKLSLYIIQICSKNDSKKKFTQDLILAITKITNK